MHIKDEDDVDQRNSFPSGSVDMIKSLTDPKGPLYTLSKKSSATGAKDLLYLNLQAHIVLKLIYKNNIPKDYVNRIFPSGWHAYFESKTSNPLET